MHAPAEPTLVATSRPLAIKALLEFVNLCAQNGADLFFLKGGDGNAVLESFHWPHLVTPEELAVGAYDEAVDFVKGHPGRFVLYGLKRGRRSPFARRTFAV